MSSVAPDTLTIDGKTYQLATDTKANPLWEVTSGQRMVKEFTPGGSMGETRCTHPRQCNNFYFGEGFDVTDGTARLHPGTTTVGTRYTGTFDDAGGTTLTDAAANFSITGDGLKGYTVTITGGTGSGAARTITGNTNTTLTVASLTTAANSTYDVSVLGSLAYTPLSFFEDFDSTATRAVYLTFRDTTTTPDIITKKIRPSDDTPIDTEIWGTATYTAPVIGRPEVFSSATYVGLGDATGSRLMQKLATVGAISTETADTWEAADAGIYAYSCASVTVGGVIKFVRASPNRIGLTASEPKTSAGYEQGKDVGDTADPITWISEMSDGLIAIHKTTNLYLWDADGNAYPVLPGNRHSARRIAAQQTGSTTGNTYDDFDGHMGSSLSAGVLHPSREGLSFYQNGAIRNVAIDQIGQGTPNPFRLVANISNIPFGNRHYACVVYGKWVYAIYKPTGFANSANVHVMCGYYDAGEIIWRTLITQAKDIIGLFIDSQMRLWWVYDPQDPDTIPGTPTAELRYITLAADGSPRTVLGASATYPRGAASATYTYYFPEIDFFEYGEDMAYIPKQLRLMTLETENLPTAGDTGVSIQLSIHPDGSNATNVGAAITTAGNAVTDREPTVGTSDTFTRGRPRLTLTTGSTYAPTSSDPRWLRLKIEVRSPDTIRCVIKPSPDRNLFETKKILRKLKNAGVRTIREPQTNETFSGQIIAVNDIIQGGAQAVEVVMHRWAIAA